MPERTCIACRSKRDPDDFFRIVAGPENRVFIELDNRLPGRGAYCCIGLKCIEKGLIAKRLAHALRASVEVPARDEVVGRLGSLLAGKIEGLLGAASRKGVVAAGREAALKAAYAEKGGRLFFAADVSKGTRSDIEGLDSSVVSELPLTMAEMGRILNRPPVGVIFIPDDSLAESLNIRSVQMRSLKTS